MRTSLVRLALMLVAALPCSSFSSFSSVELSDAAAHQIATRMERTVSIAEVNLLRAVKANDRKQYPAIVEPVHTALKAWPADHIDNRASFPYWGCKQFAVTFLQAADIWRRSDTSKSWRAGVMKNLEADSKECASALKSPDMSLKDIK